MSESQNSSKRLALIEVLFFFGLLIVIKVLVDPYLWRYAGPISLLSTLLMLSFYMRMHTQHWADFGLVRLRGWRAWWKLALRVLLTIGVMVLSLITVRYGAIALGFDSMMQATQGMAERFKNIPGSLPHYLLWMVIVWTSAAFGEEMFFRGFLITRLQTVFRGLPWAVVLAVIISAVMFGGMHVYYEGLRGLIMTGTIGLVFGSMFVLFKRNLWPIIIVHGLVDTVGITAIFMNWST